MDTTTEPTNGRAPASRGATRSRVRARALVIVTVFVLTVAVALPAFAHVTVRTDNATAGGFAVYTVRVPGGTIEPGQFQDFSFQARNPEQTGALRFPAIQAYDSGEVVEWTGDEGSDTPAGTVEVGAADGDRSPTSTGGSTLVSWLALAASILAVGLGALALRRRDRPRP